MLCGREILSHTTGSRLRQTGEHDAGHVIADPQQVIILEHLTAGNGSGHDGEGLAAQIGCIGVSALIRAVQLALDGLGLIGFGIRGASGGERQVFVHDHDVAVIWRNGDHIVNGGQLQVFFCQRVGISVINGDVHHGV